MKDSIWPSIKELKNIYMNYLIKNTLSILVFLIFIFTVVSCKTNENYNPTCEDLEKSGYIWGYYQCVLLPQPIRRDHEFKIKLLDKTTGLPLGGIHIQYTITKIYSTIYYCVVPWAILDEFEVNDGEYFNLITNADGEVNGNTPEMIYQEQKNVMIMNIQIEDATGKYSSKTISMKFLHDTDFLDETIYLLNNEEL